MKKTVDAKKMFVQFIVLVIITVLVSYRQHSTDQLFLNLFGGIIDFGLISSVCVLWAFFLSAFFSIFVHSEKKIG